jgi:PleD family two-component response regulator
MVEKSTLVIDEVEVRYTVSLGLTTNQHSPHSTISRADKAMYQAKGLGRNQVVLNTL